MSKSLSFACFILLLVFCVPAKSWAQCTLTITGQVVDATQQPVNNQMIYLDLPGLNLAYAASTTPNGSYAFNATAPCSNFTDAVIYTIACGDTLYQTLWVSTDSTYYVPFTVCDTAAPANCPGVVFVTPIQQGIALSYQIPGATNIVVSFGDNPGAVFFSPGNHIYADSGTYNVCVTAYTAQCVFDTCFTVNIALSTAPDDCYADGQVSPYGVNGIEFGWSGYNSLGLPPTSVVWDFGDGNSSNNYPNGGTYTYAQAGSYYACVTLTWATGCTATECDTVLVGNPPFNVCGWVGYEDNNGDTIPHWLDCGTVYLIAIDSSGYNVIDSVSVTPNGFCFPNQAPGDYTVLAVPCDSVATAYNLLPTYLGNELFWQDAAIYNGFGQIILIDGQNTQGPGLIGGTVVWGDKAIGDPIAGIRVLLLDHDANPIAFAVTDQEGYYSFDQLPYGTYRIYPEYPGYTTYPALVTLSPENPTVETANFGLGSGIFMGIEEMPATIRGLYPNPAADKATLSLVSKETGNAQVQFVDLAGKTVASFPVSITQGQQNIQLDVTSLKAGLYTVTLTVRGQQMHTKLIKQ